MVWLVCYRPEYISDTVDNRGRSRSPPAMTAHRPQRSLDGRGCQPTCNDRFGKDRSVTPARRGMTSTGILPVEGMAVIFGVYRFMSMAISTCNTIGNSVATVLIAKWSRTFDPKVAERHLYPERYPDTPQADAALEDDNLLPED